MIRPLHRRGLLRTLAAAPLAALARPARAATEDFPGHVTLFVAGPPGGGLDLLSRSLALNLREHLPSGTSLGLDAIGGLDGVTGANQFAVQATADGGTVLLVPGAAPLAWLVGDSRVHFDPSHWLPILAGTGPAIVVARRDAPLPRPGAHIRVAGGGPSSAALAAMLALDLLGAQVEATGGLGEDLAALASVQAGHTDMALLRRADGLDLLATRFTHVRPLFSFGTADPDGIIHRDLMAADVPTLVEYAAAAGLPPLAGPRFDAWRCAAGAVQLHYALVLPTLTPPSAVALWREAGAHALAPDLAASAGVVQASAASELVGALTPGSPALLNLRSWMADHLGWRPG